MLTQPAGLTEDELAAALTRGWGLTAASLTYRPVGFGSHHWEVLDTAGTRWFVNVDDLAARRNHAAEPLETVRARLLASLATARALADAGLDFVVAPVVARTGAPLVPITDQFAVAVYPFVDGQSFGWGAFSAPAHRRGVLDLLIALHAADPPATLRPDDLTIDCRDQLEDALAASAPPPGRGPASSGPYGRPAAVLVFRNEAVATLLSRYDDLVAQARTLPERAVLTHGEPHPGNTMRAGDRWLLIDWDTALLAPPERDLWDLDPGDGSILAAYAEATGVPPLPAMCELYRIRWDLTDIALFVSHFRRPHAGTADDQEQFDDLRGIITRIGQAQVG